MDESVHMVLYQLCIAVEVRAFEFFECRLLRTVRGIAMMISPWCTEDCSE